MMALGLLQDELDNKQLLVAHCKATFYRIRQQTVFGGTLEGNIL
jgi:hypothetical protein